MPRRARTLSESGIYHAMVRGVNRQPIFTSDGDKERYLVFLWASSHKQKVSVHAYCLMDNHVHLLIRQDGDSPIGEFFRSLGTRYAGWFNTEYGRVGHLFQGRFKSKPVETDAYLLSVVRYIHLNPVESGMCEDPGDYRFSSYSAYAEDGQPKRSKGLSTDLISPLLTPLQCRELHLSDNRDLCELGFLREEGRLSDERALEIVERIYGLAPDGIGRLDPGTRDLLIRQIVESGMPRSQLARIGGMSKKTIADALDSKRHALGAREYGDAIHRQQVV